MLHVEEGGGRGSAACGPDSQTRKGHLGMWELDTIDLQVRVENQRPKGRKKKGMKQNMAEMKNENMKEKRMTEKQKGRVSERS